MIYLVTLFNCYTDELQWPIWICIRKKTFTCVRMEITYLIKDKWLVWEATPRSKRRSAGHIPSVSTWASILCIVLGALPHNLNTPAFHLFTICSVRWRSKRNMWKFVIAKSRVYELSRINKDISRVIDTHRSIDAWRRRRKKKKFRISKVLCYVWKLSLGNSERMRFEAISITKR